jgi:hypothetical protein
MNSLFSDFIVQALAGIVGVFVGVWLALILERKRGDREEAKTETGRQEEYSRARHMVLGSVIKNANEANRLRRRIDKRKPSELLHPRLELSVWDAVQTQFMQACTNIDERVRLAQFFDGVRDLKSFFDFHRDLQLSIAGAIHEHDPELAEILKDADQHLRELVEDQRFNGVLLITDFGEPVHKKLMGLNQST